MMAKNKKIWFKNERIYLITDDGYILATNFEKRGKDINWRHY